MAGRKPDYDVYAMNKATNEKNKVGGAWVNDSGSIAVVLAPFVVISASKDVIVTLFPRKANT